MFFRKASVRKGLVIFTIHGGIEDQIRRGVSTYGLDPGRIPDSCWNGKARDARINVSRGNSKVDHSARWNGMVRFEIERSVQPFGLDSEAIVIRWPDPLPVGTRLSLVVPLCGRKCRALRE